MNISCFRQSLLLGLTGAFTLAAGIASAASVVSSLSSNSEDCLIDCEISQTIGTGGTNPLILEALRQETYRNREAAALQAEMNPEQESVEIGSVIPTATPYPEVINYPENFPTIGEQAAIENRENKVIIDFAASSQEVTRMATQTEENNCSSQFSDITENANASNIQILDCLNIVSGRQDTIFAADEIITRNEAVKIALLISGQEVDADALNTINDIEDFDWSVPYTEQALQDEVIFLDDQNNFGGSAPVYYEEAFALYLNSADVALYGSSVSETEEFSFYGEYRDESNARICIENFPMPAEEETITRGDFATLSLHILSVLLQDRTFEGPTQQLDTPQFSASRQEAVNPELIFPEIFRRDDE